MQNKEERKVLLQISNLKQYFPVGKKGMFVKANDGISIDIYEARPSAWLVSLAAESPRWAGLSSSCISKPMAAPCTLAAPLMSLRPSMCTTPSATWEPGRSICLPPGRNTRNFQAEYDKLPEQEQYLKHAELTKLRKEPTMLCWMWQRWWVASLLPRI